MINANNYLLRIHNLKTYFPIKKGLLRRTIGYVKAVDNISFNVQKGQALGLVGESGSGKTTIARSILRLIPTISGQIFFEHVDILSSDRAKLQQLRKQIGLIFQDPFSSLNPRMTVGNIISEPLKDCGTEGQRVCKLLLKVGLSKEYINRYPHELSGGQRQRIAIARALALETKMLICDEPTSALDVSIQAKIMNLLKDLQEEFGLTFLFIAHNLALAEFFCDVVAVMYMGKILEHASAAQLYQNPLHPYTSTLISAMPKMEQTFRNRRIVTPTVIADTLNTGVGCVFYPRCPFRYGHCLKQMPTLKENSTDKGHFVACWKYQ